MGAKTAKAGTAGHANDDISHHNLQRYKTEGQAMLERIVTGDEAWVHHYQPETKQASRQWKQRIADSDQVQGCALSEQSDDDHVLGHERSIAC